MDAPGRNDDCSCGSGKKYKKCCLGKTEPAASAAPIQDAQAALNEAVQAALLHHQAGRFQQAAEIYQQILQIQPDHADALHLLGVIAHQDGQHALALDLISRAIQVASSIALYYSNIAPVLLALELKNEALACYLKAVELQPDHVEALNNVGDLLQQLGRVDEAVSSYQRAISIKPDYAEAHYNLGNTLRELGRPEDALASYREALSYKPAFPDAHNNIGLVLAEMGRDEEALPSYYQALALRPDYAAAHNNLGAALKALDRNEEAREHLMRAQAIAPDYAEAYCNLGNLEQAIGQLEAASLQYRQALVLKPDYAEAYSNLGITLQEMDRLDDAEISYLRALQIKPDFADALLSLGNLFCGFDDLIQATAAYQKTVAVDPSNRGLDAMVNLAILHYLNNNLDQCQSNLVASHPIMAKSDLKQKNYRSYWCYLEKLLSWHLKNSKTKIQTTDLKPLYVIGDSHSLAAHGVMIRYREQEMRCATEWIVGCKQWHLGNSRVNIYKRKFEAVMARLPRNSIIALFIGEIDCRHDEGILKAWKKCPDIALAEIVRSTVTAYLGYVSSIGTRYGHRFVIGGVPSTNIQLETLTMTTAEQLVCLIQIFNSTLKELTLAAGMDFLDIYALTNNGEGVANTKWYIDDFHLLPSAVVEAFDRYCVYQQ